MANIFDNLRDAFAVADSDATAVILPPAIDRLTDEEEEADEEEEFIPHDVAGQIEIQEASETDSESDGEAPPLKKRKPKLIPKWSIGHDHHRNVFPDAELPSVAEKYPVLVAKSPWEIFSLFYDRTLKEEIIAQTILYAGQKNVHAFTMDEVDLDKFMGVFYISGYHRVLREEDMWNRDSDLGIDMVFDNINRASFREIKKYLHFADNLQDITGITDKMWKVRPLMDAVNQRLVQFGCFCKHCSADEQMLPYYGIHSCKQFIRGKPKRFGYKSWSLCCEHGYPFTFDIYQGKGDDTGDFDDQTHGNIGMGGRVVMKLVTKVMEEPRYHDLYIDNFFTSYALLRSLADKHLKCTGTLRQNRLPASPLPSKAKVDKEPRGTFHYASDGEICCVTWKDNAVVLIGSNYDTALPSVTVDRRKKGGGTSFEQPKMISNYNKFMGGVDLVDRHISNLRSAMRKRVWYWPIVKHSFEMLRVAAYTFYRHLHPESKMKQYDFVREITRHLLTSHGRKPQSRQRQADPQPMLAVAAQSPIRHGLVTHSQGRCIICKKNTVLRCSECNVRLHRGCSALFSHAI
jgi:hypothetical protein